MIHRAARRFPTLALMACLGAGVAGAVPAGAQMTLTPTAALAGYTLDTYASPYPGGCAQGAGGGVDWVAYLTNGKVLAYDIVSHTLYSLPSHLNGLAGPGTVIKTYNGAVESVPFGLCQLQIGGVWHYYFTSLQGLIEFNPNTGNPIQPVCAVFNALACVPFPPGVSSPHAGHIFISALPPGGPAILEVDPVNLTSALFAPTPDGGSEGMAFSTDGAYLYVAADSLYAIPTAPGPGTPWAVRPSAWGTNSALAFTSVAVGVGNLDGFLYGLSFYGEIFELGIPTGPHALAEQLIAAGGVRSEALCADADVMCPGGYPSLIVTQCDRLLRLDPTGGGWFGGPTSSLAGLAGTSAVPLEPTPPSPTPIEVAPNPTAGVIRVTYSLPREEAVHLSVIDVQGREVARLADGTVAAGRHELTWGGLTPRGPAVPGVYFAVLRAGGTSSMRRFTRVR